MARFRWIALFAGLAGCSSGDVCHQFLTVLQDGITAPYACLSGSLSEAALQGILADAGLADAGALLASCETTLAACSPSDQAIVQRYVSCYQDLPAFQCKWTTEDPLTDPTYLAFIDAGIYCTGLLVDAGLSSSCGFGGSESSSSSGTPSWSGSYVVSDAFFDDGASDTLPSGTETLTQTDDTIVWPGFAAPSIPGCVLTLQSSDTLASLDSLRCKGWSFQSGTATLFQVSPQQIDVNASGTDPDGGFFRVSYTLTAQ